MASKLLDIVVCCTPSNGIGAGNKLPWRLANEMKYFAKLTTGNPDQSGRNVVLMGRNTWESIPSRFRPLKNRINVVLSRNWTSSTVNQSNEPNLPDYVYGSMKEALDHLNQRKDVNRVFVIGGASVYQEALNSDLVHRVYLTRLQHEFECDVFFPLLEVPEKYKTVSCDQITEEEQIENGIRYRYYVYERV